tara:strand:- start:62 stop:748 length:687 start_codon:yes stop_codon:yes gene_type:complete
MSKAYLFAVMLLAASLTGCIESGDELEKSTSPNEEEDILQPVGTDGNETVSHDELIAEIANLTEQVKELNEQIAVLSDDLQSLEYYQYNPPENSTIYVYDFNDFNDSKFVKFIVTKTGNLVHVEYAGPMLSSSFWPLDDGTDNEPNHEFSNATCAPFSSIAFYTSDMSIIQEGYAIDTADEYTRECNLDTGNVEEHDIAYYNTFFSTASFELKQEPVRIALYGQTLTF